MAAALLAVHPMPLELEPPPPAGEPQPPPPPVWVNGLPVAEGTPWGLALRTAQVVCATMVFMVMPGLSEVPLFWVLAGAAGAQCLWNLALIILNIYALLLSRGLQSRKPLFLFVLGDMIFGALVSFGAACTSAGVTTFMDDLKVCSEFECGRFKAATAMGFMSWLFVAPSLFLNLWSLISSFF